MTEREDISERPGRGQFWLAVGVAFLTLVLLGAGGLVTSNEAGDSVPDWPMSFGRWVIGSDQFVANVRFEYSHRVIAGAVGIATFILALWITLGEKRRWVKRLAWIAFAGVVAQAAIGGVRVLFPEYKAAVSVPHALIAQSFFALLVGLAVFSSRSWQTRKTAPKDAGKSSSPSLRFLTSATVASVLVQLVLGAGFRHRAFGIIPHIAGAVAVTILLVWTVSAVLRRYGSDAFLCRPALVALGLLITQVGLGVGAYMARLGSADDPLPMEPMITLTVAHLVVGALTLAAVVVLTLRSYRAISPRESAREATQERESVPRPVREGIIKVPYEESAIRNSQSAIRSPDRLRAYLDLTKPRITLLVVLTAAAGFCLGSGQAISYTGLLHMAVGITLLSSGIGTLNQYMERRLDALMLRTGSRPLPSGKLTAREALLFGIVLSVVATIYLAVFLNLLTAVLGTVTLAAYLFLYTPLKTRTTLSTVLGAFPGAMPPLIGWVAASGEIGLGAWVLFAILFLWQFPHFLAIAWMYRDDYARAGIRMLPVVEPEGRVTGQQILSYTLMLLPVSLLPAMIQLAGSVYFFGALMLGLGFLYFSVRMAFDRSKWRARRLLQASVLYLPALLALMVLNR
ncbi:MAG: heme o synthase [Blastocatellia bacterium]|nr:heme o synthase [Blastocatellia bacterium]